MIAVSGGLQDGFPGRDKLDYITETERSRATLIGKAFVRGYKSYLDVMEEDYREYMPLEQSTVNPNVFASGCYEHANEYFVYLVDARQVFQVLLHEPRFLSITPDTGWTEIQFSSPLVQAIAKHEISLDEKTKNMEQVAFPLVTAVHFQSTSLIETPHVKEVDGSKVTNYPESIALWAGADNKDRLEYIQAYEDCLYDSSSSSSSSSCDMESHESFQRYWTTIRQAIQKVRDERATTSSSPPTTPQPNTWKCQKRVRFGTSKETTRMQRAYTAKSFQTMLQTINNKKETNIVYDIDFGKGKIITSTTTLVDDTNEL